MFTKARWWRGRLEPTQHEHRHTRCLLLFWGVYSSISSLQVFASSLPQSDIWKLCMSLSGSRSSSSDTRLEMLTEQKRPPSTSVSRHHVVLHQGTKKKGHTIVATGHICNDGAWKKKSLTDPDRRWRRARRPPPMPRPPNSWWWTRSRSRSEVGGPQLKKRTRNISVTRLTLARCANGPWGFEDHSF